MKCPYCECSEDKVIDSRLTENGGAIRRRRECTSCGARFNTFERVEQPPIIVIKKDNSRQEYSRDKLLSGIMRACVKRPVSYDDMEKIAADIEAQITLDGSREISSVNIGDMTLRKLSRLDKVAYIRFASVYKCFDDINSFIEELENLKSAE